MLAVLLCHFELFSIGAGDIGVTIFFALSGYLITSILLAQYLNNGHLSFRTFYWHRARRLLPALFLLLVVTAFIDGFSVIPRLLPTIFYLGNFRWLFDIPVAIEHTWSLAIEEQFYIVWPLTLLLMLRLGGRTLAIRATVCAFVALNIWRIWLGLSGNATDQLYYGTDARADELLIGCLFALVGRVRMRPALANATFAAILFISVVVSNVDGFWVSEMSATGIAVLTAVLLAGITSGTLLARALSTRLMRHFGRISYGWYLWHYPIIAWCSATALFWRLNRYERFLILGTFSWFVAVLSYQLLERRFTHGPSLFKNVDKRDRSRSAG
jgi:peptidoglycan/LPS O-acetylase OafA/YrhL